SSLTSSLEPPAVLAAVLALARRLITADAYAVWRVRGPAGRWSIDLADGLSEAYRRTVVGRPEPGRPPPPEPIAADDVNEGPALGPGQVDEVRGVMLRQTEHLVRMVDDLLDVSRLLRGKIDLRSAPVDVADAVRRAVETVQPTIDALGHDLAVDLPAEPLPV